MRVSDSMIFTSIQRNSSAAQTRMLEAASRASSQRAIEKPSDDPALAARVMRADRMLASMESAERSRQTVRTDLELGESGLRAGIDVLGSSLELAIQMSNGSLSATDRASAALAVDQQIEAMRRLANTQLEDGRYLYGGTRDGSQPYPAAGGYLGGDAGRMIEIAPGAMFDAAIVGDQSFGDSDQVFKVLEDFATALRNNDLAGIQASQEAVQGQLDTFVPRLTALGTRIQVLDAMDTLTASNKLALQTRRGSMIDGDFAALVTEFTAATNTMQSVSEVSRRLMSAAFGSFAG
ncbi:MAG: hypothetical protein H6744_14075 [Deltaproteobacteria bacterium]|nr:hypothetical protein [Deltaproteobacteria bacterium]MCB9787806.1 hypothetical protein [Deltaproteobacteria bacterium]